MNIKLLFLSLVICSCSLSNNPTNIFYLDEKKNFFQNHNEKYEDDETVVIFKTGFDNDTISIFYNDKFLDELYLTSDTKSTIANNSVVLKGATEKDKLNLKSNLGKLNIKINKDYKIIYVHWNPQKKKWSIIYSNYIIRSI